MALVASIAAMASVPCKFVSILITQWAPSRAGAYFLARGFFDFFEELRQHGSGVHLLPTVPKSALRRAWVAAERPEFARAFMPTPQNLAHVGLWRHR